MRAFRLLDSIHLHEDDASVQEIIHYLVISFWSINFDLVSANQAKFMIILLFRAEHAANTKKVKVFRAIAL